MPRHRVVIVALDGVMPIDLAIPAQIFASRSDTPYETVVSTLGAAVDTSGGYAVVADGRLEELRCADTVVVPGSDYPRPQPTAVLTALAEAHRGGTRMISICTGAFVLAAAGILDGRKATTHWRFTERLKHEFPMVEVARDVLYVDEGNVLTSAGVCCGIDLCLHVVRRDVGAGVANALARGLVAAPHRDGGQAQYIPAAVPVAGDATLSATREWALSQLGQPITLRQLAQHAGVSRRSLIRRFAEETGTTPFKWLLEARLGLARDLLETTDHSVDRVADECGLGTAANLRLHFRRALDTTPTAYRRAFDSRRPA